MINFQEFRDQCAAELQKLRHPPLKYKSPQDGRIVQIPVHQQFSDGICGYACLTSMRLYGKMQLQQFDSQVRAYAAILDQLKAQGLQGLPFDQLQRYELDMLMQGDYFGKQVIGCLHYGCNVIQNDPPTMKQLAMLRDSIAKQGHGWVIAGVLIHWILVRVQYEKGVYRLIVIDSMNYPLADIMAQNTDEIQSIVKPKQEGRFAQFLKDYRQAVILLDRFFNQGLDLFREQALLQFDELMSSFALFKAGHSQQQLRFWLQTQHHPKTIQDDLLPGACHLPRVKVLEWTKQCQYETEDELILRLHRLQDEIIKACTND